MKKTAPDKDKVYRARPSELLLYFIVVVSCIAVVSHILPSN